MKTFICCCGNTLHFENTQCLGCGRRVAIAPQNIPKDCANPGQPHLRSAGCSQPVRFQHRPDQCAANGSMRRSGHAADDTGKAMHRAKARI